MLSGAGIYPALMLGACLAIATFSSPVYAAGEDTSTTPTCPKGEVWNPKTKKCVKQEGSLLPDSDLTTYAYALGKSWRYEEALAVLDTLKNPNTAIALNYRGYFTRKLGRTDEGIGYYMKSVQLDPQYAKVREYLGEAYVIKGQIDLAKEQLGMIKGICGTNCEEYRDLAEAIETPSKI
ncbi:hypothetical protein HB779_14095 [Phyllobacterium sp. 628]|nr:hypothetical protein HB779_14095 [Phyllobacterium sp. 628]